MEKFANAVAKHICFGLLIFYLFSQTVFAQNVKRFSAADAAALLIVPTEDVFFTNSSSQFVLQIPNVASSEVQMELPRFPEGISFDSSRREDFIAANNQGTRGTQIDLWFTFRQAGEFDLPPLVLYIQERRYFVKFKTVQVYENLKTILPRVSVEFQSGEKIQSGQKAAQNISFKAGESAVFTIYLQYAVGLQQFAWSVPKDSLFKELKRYEVAQTRRSTFSPELIPVATFEWVPLAQGKTSLPEIRLMATAYSGRAVYLSMPECSVQITAGTKPDAKDKTETAGGAGAENSIFAYAFTPEEKAQDEFTEGEFDVLDFVRIAQLRSVERHSFYHSNARAERIAAEKKVGIQHSPSEPSVPLFILFASCLAAALIAFLLLFLFRKRMLAVFAAVLAIVFAFFTVLFSHSIFEQYAIVTGGSLSPVPEDSALTKTQVGAGSRVQIREEIDKWYFIDFNESRGWIKKENVVLIK